MASMSRRDLLRMCGSATIGAAVFGMGQAADALELGKAAPEFTLPGTNGANVSLRQFRGKRIVLLEFFGAAFAPT